MITQLPKDSIKDEALSALARVDIAVASMACAEKTKRTKIRARAFLIALGIAALTFGGWTYAHNRLLVKQQQIDLVAKVVSLPETPETPDITPPAVPFDKQRGDGNI